MFLLRLSKGNSSGCHHANPTPFFCICHYCGKVAFCFCFDVARVFLQGASMPPLHPYFLNLSLLRERDRYSQGIFQGATMTPLHPIFFDVISVGKEIEIARGHYASASTYLGD